MRLLAAHLKPGDLLSFREPTAGLDFAGDEVLEVRQDRDAVTVLTRSGRLVTIGAARTVEIADRRNTLLG